MDKNIINKSLRSILQILQEKPAAYRAFGIYWWPIKTMLKSEYTKDNLYMLGDYEDADGAGRVPNVGIEEMIGLAFSEYHLNTVLGMGSNQVTDTEGEPYIIFDQDANV